MSATRPRHTCLHLGVCQRHLPPCMDCESPPDSQPHTVRSDANAQQLLDALQALHANMLAQDLADQMQRPTEEEYQRCMHQAAEAIRANSTPSPSPEFSDVHEDYEWCDTTASMPLGAA